MLEVSSYSVKLYPISIFFQFDLIWAILQSRMVIIIYSGDFQHLWLYLQKKDG